MEHTWLLHNLIVALGLLEECAAFPIHLGAGGVWSSGVAQGVASPLTPIALGAATLLAAAVLLVGCVCCRQQKGFQEFSDSVLSSQNNLASAPTSIQGSCYAQRSTAELTLFPPLGTTLTQPGDRSSIVQFEPLPDIHVVAAAAAAARRKPAAFGNSLHHGLSVHDWFEEPIDNFPRHQLQYLRELGRGWFGRVVEGKAKDIVSGHATSKVVVKILHEDATPTDQSYFLHEAKPYRNLKHPNVLSLVGRCLETHPFLLLLENCPYGTLKTFLTAESNNVEKLGKQGVLLEMACGMAVGLHHLVENGFVHTDLAARNCLVTSDLTVKVGDYGTSIETFKDEYYCVGDLAIPIRWVAPETLHCTDTTIETKEVTASANVWSLAIVLWEICEFGQLPYSNLSDDEVIEQVLGSCSTCLPFPTHENQLHVHNLYHLMKICWVEADKRPPLWRVVAMLQHLLQHKHSPAHTSANNNNNNSTTSLDDFERRWELSKPNTVPKIDNQLGTSSMHSSPVKSIPVQRSASLEETAVAETPVQLELNTSADRSFAAACANSPQLSVSSSISDVFISSSLLADHKSPSLQNLRGSVDNLQVEGTKENVLDKSSRLGQETLTEEPDFDSWLKGMDTTTEEDVRFVRNISEVIRDLDEVLAQEKTSSSSQNSSAQPSPSQLTLREMKPDMNVSASQDQKFTLDFRLGQAAASSVLLSRNIELLHSNGHESLSLSQHRLESSGSDTEDETWRMRIERGEFSEKVKEKSKSVADLMVLTHIEYSDGSDSDTTLDLDSCGSSFRKNGSCRRSFHRKPLQSSLSVTYGSEGNIHQAVLGEEFQETIKRLQESLRDGSKLEAIPDASLSCISSSSNEVQDNSCLTQSHSEKSNFLAKLASEKNILKNDPSCTALSDLSSLQTPDNLEENRRVMFSCQAKQEKPIESSENGSPGSILGSSQFLDSDLGPAFTHNGSEVDSVESNLEGGYEKTHVLVNGLDRLMVKALTSEEVHKITPDLSSKVIVDPGRNHTANVLNKEERPPSPITGDIQLPHADTSCVILGPFEDSTLEYFKGLKTAFPTVKTLDYDVTNEMDIEENSIETWDKFLDHAMQAENCDFPSFSDLSFSKSETESPLSECHGAIEASDILGSSFEKVAPEKTKILNTNGLDIKRGTCYVNSDCETSKWLGKAVVHPSDSGVVSSDVDIKEESPMLAAGIQGLVNSCLVVPSVHVTEATPISSGRTTPSDSKCETNDSICLANKNDFGSDLLPHSHTDLTPSPGQECSATALDVSKDLCSISSTVGFVVPQIRMSGTNTQSFDPDLPCCNVNDKNLLSNSVMRNNNYLFSGRRDIKSGESFHDELASGCFINPEVDEVALDKHFKTVIPLFSKGFDSKEGDLHADLMEDEDEFGLGVTKNLTPDDERSSDSGFRDKGSLSESCEDACDEKYNLEDIEAELEEAFSKGVFARHDSPTSTKGLESDCDVVDESFSVTLIDVEKQREQKEADLNSLKDPCHRLDDLLRGRDQFQEHASVDVESSVDFFGTSPPLSPIPQSSGWYLHPPQSHDEAGSEPVSGNDSSYFSFSLDEEFVNAIRNELREKLPCAQMPREESQPQLSDEEEHSDQDLDADESPAGDRTSITISYKSYPAPLSPILEEQESMCSDIGSPICGYDSSAYSEPMSPVFAVDHSASNQGDCDVKHVESECPAEVDGDLSDDCADCGDFDEISEHDCPPLSLVSHSLCTLNNLAVAHNICLDVDDEGNELDDDDVLVVNMETNEATILESPKPLDKFSVDGNDDCDEFNHDDFVPDFLSVAGSYQLPESNIERIRSDLYRGNRSMTLSALPQSSVGLELEDENDAMTPDSITCEKSFSERTEDSAVGLALSEIMTPDSLAGDSPWTSTQMCDSGFGTIGTRPSSSAMMSDSSERKSPVNIDDVSPIDQSSVSKESFSPQMSTEKEISKQYFLECPEISKTINCSDEGESSVSFSFDSVIDPDHITLKPSEGLKSSDPVEQKVSPSIESSDKECDEMKICDFLNGEENSLNAVRKEHCKSVPIPESALPPALSCISPQSLKEIACYVLGNDWKSKNQTLAFNNEDVMKNRQQSSVVAFGSKRNCKASVNEPHSAKECDFVINGLKKTTVEQSRPLQTLAFSDSDATERSSFPGAGHIVVSSIVTPLTPSDDTSTPGTLAFNESPESPSDVMSPMFKDSDNTEAESHLMSTSFMSADDLYDDRDRYTPDWESGSDGCESETASSSSGEFIWKDGEKESSLKAFQATPDTVAIGTSEDQTYNQNPPEFPMSAILEEEEERSGSSSCTSDSEDDAEFVPSAWDSQATPSRSALRSPDKKAEQKKNVSFKRQRYHCVYEYPRELSDSDGSDFADSPSRRRTWDLEGGSYSLHGWDLATNEGMTETHEEIRDGNALQSSTSQKLFEFYKINSTNCTFGSTMLSEDGEFFISSSAQPFHTLGEVGPAGSNEFFPGRDLSGSNDPDVDGNIDSNPTLLQLAASTETQNWEQPEEFSDSDSSDTYMVTASEGSFNQQRSSDSNSSLTPMVTANGSSKSSDDSSIYHSLPTNQELQVDSGSDSPLSELSPTSPLSPISPSHGLGELRHTRDRLKLDLPASNTTLVLVAPCKRRSVEQVRGEASLLDGEDIFEGSICKSTSPHLSENVPVGSDVH